MRVTFLAATTKTTTGTAATSVNTNEAEVTTGAATTTAVKTTETGTRAGSGSSRESVSQAAVRITAPTDPESGTRAPTPDIVATTSGVPTIVTAATTAATTGIASNTEGESAALLRRGIGNLKSASGKLIAPESSIGPRQLASPKQSVRAAAGLLTEVAQGAAALTNAPAVPRARPALLGQTLSPREASRGSLRSRLTMPHTLRRWRRLKPCSTGACKLG
mmetsp:Transcript_7658/g.19546  ORF Transcript_7658/g.19546 Transcript_7658/m.19546 type:complete len:220 (-) Transcript_7658:169-828(-)